MGKSGFTLVELMVVIAIIAILAVGSITGYDAYLKKGYTSQTISSMVDINRRMSICLDGIGDDCQFSAKTCTEFGWSSAGAFTGDIIKHVADCAESDNGIGGCLSEVSWDDANKKCEAYGARLCTADEIEDTFGVGTGCSFDNMNIWTMSMCDDAKGFVAIEGRDGRADDRFCETDIFNSIGKGVRCCADDPGDYTG